jgi:hypothetical protein
MGKEGRGAGCCRWRCGKGPLREGAGTGAQAGAGAGAGAVDRTLTEGCWPCKAKRVARSKWPCSRLLRGRRLF